MASQEFPLAPYEHLTSRYLGKPLAAIPTPAAVVDVFKARQNCNLMLEAVKHLDISFRAHVKTHKTTQLTRLQVGEDSKDVRLIVSTVLELEQLLPLMLEYRASDARVNVLYGVPVPPSQAKRLGTLGKKLGPDSVTVMIDHPGQLPALERFKETAGFPARIFVKIDSGTHRAGLHPGAAGLHKLLTEIGAMEAVGHVILYGYYSHAGHSYAGDTPSDAMDMLRHEISVCVDAARSAPVQVSGSRNLTLSVGASPTALSAQNLNKGDGSDGSAMGLRDFLQGTKASFEVELHAGVYPLLDMQQVVTHARENDEEPYDSIALTILAEVCSLYTEREKPEALMAAGCLALAREPCKDYRGWGVVAPWGLGKDTLNPRQRLIVERISQEHGILAFEHADHDGDIPLRIGQKVRIWPNHACITSAMYDWYLIVDSSLKEPDTVVDIWQRWRGW